MREMGILLTGKVPAWKELTVLLATPCLSHTTITQRRGLIHAAVGAMNRLQGRPTPPDEKRHELRAPARCTPRGRGPSSASVSQLWWAGSGATTAIL